MPLMNTYCFRPYLNQISSQCLSVATLTTLSLLLGWTPNLSERSPTLVFSSSAYADSFSVSDQEVYQFAQAGYQIEQLRQDAYNKIKTILGKTPPEIDCSHNIPNLPDKAKTIAEKFCQDSLKVVNNSDLAIPRFNQIAVAKENDMVLKQRIQKAVACIQNGTPSAKCF